MQRFTSDILLRSLADVDIAEWLINSGTLVNHFSLGYLRPAWTTLAHLGLMVLNLGNDALWAQDQVLEKHIAHLFEGLTRRHIAGKASLVLV